MSKEAKSRLIKASVSLVTIIILLIFASIAWFASNKKSSASGLSITAKASANLVIADDSTDIQRKTWDAINVNFGEANKKYALCTHDSDYSIYKYGLKYVKNTHKVDYDTGNMKLDNTENWGVAQNSSDKPPYFIQKTVYIAANGEKIPSATLVVELTTAETKSGEGDSKEDIESGPLMSASVDFYVVADGTPSYVGTTNVKNKNKDENNSVTLLNSGSLIPKNTDGYIEVLMRFYFDGALQNDDEPSNAYVSSATVDASVASLGVTFTAIESD